MLILLYILIILSYWLFRERILVFGRSYSLGYLKKLRTHWETELSRVIMSPQLGSGCAEIPSFKFYTGLCHEVVGSAKSLGVEYRDTLVRIREQAQHDFRFSVKVLQVFWQAIAQFFVIVVITWGFMWAVKVSLNEPVKISLVYRVAGLQIIGLIFFTLIFYMIRQNRFQIFERYFSSLYMFRGLVKINLPFRQLCQKSKILELMEDPGGFSDIQSALKAIIDQVVNYGGEGVEERIELICSELRFKQEQHFDKAEQLLTAAKLVIILFFFVPAYLLNIYSILGKITGI